MRASLLLLTLVAGASALPALAQPARGPTPDPDRRAPDWSRARDHTLKAERIAGEQWATTARYFCYPGAQANRIADPTVEPMKLFDQVYVIGDQGTVVYVVKTADGLVLIDAFYPEKMESVLLPGMAKLGLDPAEVKLVLVAHGHIDHFGAAAYFQERYGARIGVSQADWDMIEKAPANPAAKAPKRDLVLVDGQTVTHGGVAFTPVLTPGHTPGSMGFVFPVSDAGRRHTAAIFGSSVLTTWRLTVQQLSQHLAGIEHFSDVARKMKVDVELQNHPLFDGMWVKAAALEARAPGQAHPYVVGQPAYGRFMATLGECMKVALAKRGALTP